MSETKEPTKPIQPHQWTNADGEVLILRRIGKDRKSKNDFAYPTGVGTVVEAPDWNPEPVCGGGLHGWPWGFGLGEGMDYDIIEDIWLVIAAKPGDVVGELEKGLKCKIRRGAIRFEGAFKLAWDIVASERTKIIQNLAAVSDWKQLASSGLSAKLASSGHSAKLTSSGL